MLRIEALSAGYSQLPIIQDVSLGVDEGRMLAIIGPNGSGKSTLLKATIGILKPMSGRVLVADADVAGWPSHAIVRRGVGYVPQLSNVFQSLTVVENLEMGAYSYGGNVRLRLQHIFDTFPDLADGRHKKGGELSGGQRNLLGVARALMSEPGLLLVDEPTAGLAPINSQRIWDQLVTIASGGTAVVVVEQNVDFALRHAHAACVMVAGRVKLCAEASDIIDRDLHAMFLGQDTPEDSGISSRVATQPESARPTPHE
jgi:ABC-type branched-subunit amino acid transport system ATPase component